MADLADIVTAARQYEEIVRQRQDLEKLLKNLLLTFAFLILVFVFLYIVIIHSSSQTIIKLVNYIKKNEPCDECNSFIKEIEELKESYNNLHYKHTFLHIFSTFSFFLFSHL